MAKFARASDVNSLFFYIGLLAVAAGMIFGSWYSAVGVARPQPVEPVLLLDGFSTADGQVFMRLRLVNPTTHTIYYHGALVDNTPVTQTEHQVGERWEMRNIPWWQLMGYMEYTLPPSDVRTVLVPLMGDERRVRIGVQVKDGRASRATLLWSEPITIPLGVRAQLSHRWFVRSVQFKIEGIQRQLAEWRNKAVH